MTGTDYNEIINDRNKTTATIRHKGQPDLSHIAGANQARLKMRTCNGDDAHLWPARRYCDISANDTETYNRKLKRRAEVVAKRKIELREKNEHEEIKKKIQPLDIIFGVISGTV